MTRPLIVLCGEVIQIPCDTPATLPSRTISSVAVDGGFAPGPLPGCVNPSIRRPARSVSVGNAMSGMITCGPGPGIAKTMVSEALGGASALVIAARSDPGTRSCVVVTTKIPAADGAAGTTVRSSTSAPIPMMYPGNGRMSLRLLD
ncbi:MAG: hypothetical protein IPP94_07855 [Ignavibacteria bacterium]|nr:hypothetical protein [Ignavibacteria bacterium]